MMKLYILKNAFRCIWRSKARNILIGLVVLLLSVSSCIGLSIKQANKTLKKQYADSMEIKATLNPKNMRENGSISLDTLNSLAAEKTVKDFYYTTSVYLAAGDGIEPLDVAGSFKQNKDFREEHGDIRNGQTTQTTESTADTTAAKAEEKGTVVTLANDQSNPSGTNDDSSKEEPPKQDDAEKKDDTEQGEKNDNPQTQPQAPTQNENQDNSQKSENGNSAAPTPPQMPNDSNGQGNMREPDRNTFITNNFFFNMASMNDFTAVGYSSSSAIPDYIAELNVLTADSTDLNCVISKNLADQNSLSEGSTFKLKNPDNEDEIFEFTVVGICDTSKSSETSDTSSNAAFTDNFIYLSGAAIDSIIASTETTNGTEEESKALKPTYSGTFVFANLTDYNTFTGKLDENYTAVSTDVQNYEKSISQLETLGKYATYFLIVIFIIGAFVLIIINLFSIRNRKYEIGVLTAIGMKKQKVALQFVTELFVVTFAAIIIGSFIGAVSSVPVTNSLLTTINSSETAETTDKAPDSENGMQAPPDMPGDENGNTADNGRKEMPGGFGQRMERFGGRINNYVASVQSATDITVILQMILVGLGLTLVSSLAAVLFVMRYEPLKILNNRD